MQNKDDFDSLLAKVKSEQRRVLIDVIFKASVAIVIPIAAYFINRHYYLEEKIAKLEIETALLNRSVDMYEDNFKLHIKPRDQLIEHCNDMNQKQTKAIEFISSEVTQLKKLSEMWYIMDFNNKPERVK